MKESLIIAAGGAAGAVMRYWLGHFVYVLFGRGFPYGTLIVNLLGSAAIGFLYVLLMERLPGAWQWRALLMVGFVGALTTFSTFALDTVLLLEQGHLLKAALNIVFSILFCLAATYGALLVTRQLMA